MAANLTLAPIGPRIGQLQSFISNFELGERRVETAEFPKVSKASAPIPIKSCGKPKQIKTLRQPAGIEFLLTSSF